MTTRVGVWLDHRRAVIVTVRGSRITVDHEQISIEPPSRGGGLRSHGPGAHGLTTHGVDPDQRLRNREQREVDRFYDRLLAYLEPAAEIHLVGPGTAKVELRKKVQAHKPLAGRPVHTGSCGQMTGAQIVAHLRERLGVPAPRALAAHA